MLAGGAFADFLVQHLNEALEDEDLDTDTESDMEELKENLESVLGKSKLKKKLDEVDRTFVQLYHQLGYTWYLYFFHTGQVSDSTK